MTNTDTHECIVCARSDNEVPLIALNYQGKQYWVCPQDLPVLIHKPHMLVGKLPGAENLSGHAH
ncbi:MAG TPA: hypothetical protein VIO36_01105 [Anaerolineaceae bacterium]